jgi:hypothetical protein
MRQWISRSLVLLAAMMVSMGAWAIEWPQEIDTPHGTIVVYQPQPESLRGNTLTGRAAMALNLKNRKDPIFGAMWFTARLDTDRAAGIATARDIKITQVRWPDSKDADEQRFTKIVEAAAPTSGLQISLERLTASLAMADKEQKSLSELKNEAPKIVFSDTLAVLLLFDGEPRFTPIDKSPYERALNTPFVVVKDKGGRHWLSSGVLWYEAAGPKGPWTVSKSPPADLVKMAPKPEAPEPGPKLAPKIIVATEPTELIATDGKARWKSLAGGKLLYVENTETAWVRELASGTMFVLLSGRWFSAKSEAGPWTFVRADQLPTAFRDIPPASEIGGLRSAVAGTPEAEEAVLDAHIPQTAAIKRSEAKLEVSYDGAPKFEPVTGTSVQYAVNTATQVLKIGERFYAVDHGVWFTSSAATGPWVVADKIPDEEIKKIPPSSPVYNTTYVTVYDSTPDVVYVGYTPGYMWSFPYYGVPVYGTGWYYPPYWGSVFYPRPPTWGFNVGYNPWTGWTFGLSWSVGFFNVGVSWGGHGGYYRPCCGGWYGGAVNRPVIINTGNINIGNNVNIGNRVNVGNKLNNNKINISQNNLYKRPENRDRVASRDLVTRDMQQARATRDRPNNVFVDKGGDVVRKNGDRWEVREDGKWKPDAGTRDRLPDSKPAVADKTRDVQRPALPTPAERPAVPDRAPTHELNRDISRDTPRPQTRPAPAAQPRIDKAELNRANQARQTGRSREMARPVPHGGAAARGHMAR